MKPFTKPELKSLVIIFSVLVMVSIPNFIVSLRRARDQVRRDDLGALEKVLGEYLADFKEFPPSGGDGRIMELAWGKDSFDKYMHILPADPHTAKGVRYMYFSDSGRYQIFASMEGKDEAEIDQKIIDRGLMCGSRVCNVGRFYGCDTAKSIEECEREAGER